MFNCVIVAPDLLNDRVRFKIIVNGAFYNTFNFEKFLSAEFYCASRCTALNKNVRKKLYTFDIYNISYLIKKTFRRTQLDLRPVGRIYRGRGVQGSAPLRYRFIIHNKNIQNQTLYICRIYWNIWNNIMLKLGIFYLSFFIIR